MAKRKTREKKSRGKKAQGSKNPPNGKNSSSNKNSLNNKLNHENDSNGGNSPGGNAAMPRDMDRDNGHLTLVAIGASAGGIEAVSELIKDLPADSGLSFVLVQHLDPNHHSLLTDLLSKQTSMEVSEVENGMRIERNHIYVIPPNTSMSILDRELKLRPREESRAAV